MTAVNASLPAKTTLTLPRMTDAHVHFREGQRTKAYIAHTSKFCHHCLAMPNVNPPATTPERYTQYLNELFAAAPSKNPKLIHLAFQLTEQTTPEMIGLFAHLGTPAGKLYPEAVTTNSGNGVSRATLNKPTQAFQDTLAAMEAKNIVLCIHGEMPPPVSSTLETTFVTDKIVNSGFETWDYMELKIHNFVRWLVANFPKLRIVMEHISDFASVDLVQYTSNGNLVATITAHHMILTTDDILSSGIQPHHYCKPVVKTRQDRNALIQAATSGDHRFFLGSDSAPHTRENKENACGCAGIFTAPILPQLLTEIFDTQNVTGKLEDFVAHFGNAFYGWSKPKDTFTLRKETWTVPPEYNGVVPLAAGKKLAWG